MIDDENEIVLIDREEELEKETNPIRLKFEKVKQSCNKVQCLINMMLTALNNEFDETEIDDIIDYTCLIIEQLENHKKELDKFFNDLEIPQSKTKLIGLSYHKFKD